MSNHMPGLGIMLRLVHGSVPIVPMGTRCQVVPTTTTAHNAPVHHSAWQATSLAPSFILRCRPELQVEGLQRLVRTLYYSLPAIINVGSVMLLFFFVWAVLGMNLFGDIKYGEYLNRHANFEDWPSAMMTLFR